MARAETKAEHTPTPWKVFTTTDGCKLVGIGGVDGEGVLDCGFGVWSWNHAEGIANANLVVTAVNSHDSLVKALQAAEAAYEALMGRYGYRTYQELEDIATKLRQEALALATPHPETAVSP